MSLQLLRPRTSCWLRPALLRQSLIRFEISTLQTPPTASANPELEELKTALKISQAENENQRKFYSKQRKEIECQSLARFARSMLPVADSLRLSHNYWVQNNTLQEKNGDEEHPMRVSLGQTVKLMESKISGMGVKTISVKLGDRMDPDIHEAVHVQSDPTVPLNSILEVLEDGYVLECNDTTIVLRPSKVICSGK